MVFCRRDYAKVIISDELELQQHVKKELFMHPVLTGDDNSDGEMVEIESEEDKVYRMKTQLECHTIAKVAIERRGFIKHACSEIVF